MALLLVLSPSSATAKASPGMPAESTSSISSGAAGAAGFAPLALMSTPSTARAERRRSAVVAWNVEGGKNVEERRQESPPRVRCI